MPVAASGKVIRHARAGLAIVAAIGVTACAADVAAGGSHRRGTAVIARYYLALGDSLSRGVQPNAAGVSTPTQQGYADQLYTALRRRSPGLRLVKLGCPGETTGTMINGGLCRYAAGSQLAAAVSFLRANRGRVSLITIDIGANDPDSCITQPSLGKVASCIGTAVPATAANLTKIMTALREAGGSRIRIIGMNYYLPELALWRDGLAGRVLAQLSERLAIGYNSMLTTVYQAYGARIANVFSAFRTEDFTGRVALPGLGQLPPNVAAVCRWTWECARPPRGPNEHANVTGYRVIADAFLRADLRSAG
jgi:lysophospholipase L1-like esterase